jgi:hypothetical protein
MGFWKKAEASSLHNYCLVALALLLAEVTAACSADFCLCSQGAVAM